MGCRGLEKTGASNGELDTMRDRSTPGDVRRKCNFRPKLSMYNLLGDMGVMTRQSSGC